MREYLLAVVLAVAVVLTIIFIGSAVTGLVRGRVKVEPSQPWFVLRERPVQFMACALWYVGWGIMWAVASARLATQLLK